MIRLAVRGVVTRPTQSLIVAVGLALTLVGFAGLEAGARSTTASLSGDVGQAWDTPFDLLVRPAGSLEPLEARDQLVRPNYIGGIHGGITMGQLADVRAVPGVTLAAPMASVGAVNWPSAFQLRLSDSSKRTLVYRITATVDGQAGLSHYPVETRFVVVAPRGELTFETGDLDLPGRQSSIACRYPVTCFAGTVCFGGSCEPGQYPSAADANYYLPLLQPVLVAGIDPVAEARLTGLDACVREGSMLAADDEPSATQDPEPAEILPVMASNDAFLDQVLHVHVASAALGDNGSPDGIRQWARGGEHRVSLQRLYRDYLRTSVHDYLDPWPIWSAGDVHYRTVGPDHLAATPVPADSEIYRRVNTFSEVGIDDSLLVPPEAADPWLRSVTEHADTEAPGEGSSYRSKVWDVVGRYDPHCLPGFDPLAGGSLEGYAAPRVETSDGRVITPSRSMSDYVASPPLLLTTLAGARWLSDPGRYEGQPGDAFISVIRVRVAGTGEPGDESERLLAAAALAIHERTGLQVDVVKGASTRSIAIDLPAGSFGRPAMTVEEGWSVKGVALTFLRAVRDQDRGLLALLLITAGLLIGQATFTAVRQRRPQLSRLRALGWSPVRLAALVELETLVLAATAGLAAGLISAPIASHLHTSVWRAVQAPALGLAVAAVSALPAAWTASRGTAASALGQPRPVRASRPPRTSFGLAMRELRSAWAVEATVGMVAVAVGATLVGLVVLVAAGFREQLDSTLLGTALDTQVGPFHVVLAALTMTLGAAAAAEVVVLAWLGRRRELGVLKALGWPGRRLASVVVWQATIVGAGGALLAVPTVVVFAALTGGTGRSAALAAAGSLASCALASTAAALVPCALAVLTPARRLLAA